MGYDPLGLDQPQSQSQAGYDPLGLGAPEAKPPTYWEAAKTGLKESISSGLCRFEAPIKATGIPKMLQDAGIIGPGLEASELFKPSEEETRKPYSIPQQVVRGLAGAPATVASYAPYIAALGPVGGFVAPEAAEMAGEAVEGKPRPPLEMAKGLGEAAGLGLGFKYLPPGLKYRIPGLAGMFGAQSFIETPGTIAERAKASIAPTIIGGAMGLLGGGREEQPKPAEMPPPHEYYTNRPHPGSNLPVPYEGGRGEFPAPIGRGGPPVDMVYNARTGTYEPRDIYRPEPMEPRQLPYGRELPRPGEEHYGPITPPSPRPDWEKTREWPPPQYPPVPYEPRTAPFRPPEVPAGPPEAVKPPPPAPTPPPPAKAPEAPVKPPTDKQMAAIREQADKLDGLSIDLIKRWTGLGTKRANAILEDLVNKGEVVPGGPDSKFPWKFKGEPKPEMDPELFGTIRELRGIIQIGQPSGVLAKGEGRYGSSQAIEKVVGMEGVSRAEALAAIEKGLRGEEFKTTKKRREAGEPKQKEIWDSITRQAKEIIGDRKADEEMDRARAEIAKENLLKADLTNHIDEEIMGLKEKLRENHSDAEIDRAIEEATKTYNAETPPANIEEFERKVRFLLPKPAPKVTEPEIPKVEGLTYIGKDTIPPEINLEPNHHFNITEEAATKAGVPDAEGATITTTDISPENLKRAMDAKIEEFRAPKKSPTRAGEQLLPGMRVGLEPPKEGAPMGTLEGTPLGEAARKAEIEKVQPKLPLEKEKPPSRFIPGIGDNVVARTDKGEFRGQVAEIDQNGNIRVGLPGGGMIEARPDQVFPGGSRLAVKVGDEIFGGLEEHATLEGVDLATIAKIRDRGLDPTNGKVGYEDPRGGFTEIPKPEPEPPPSADPLKTFVDAKGVDFDSLTDKQKERWKTQKEKEDKEKGQARTGEAPREPLSREAVDAFAKERLKILKNAPETEIVDMVDIPERLSNQLNENMQKGIKGIYDPVSKKIFLIRDMMGSEEDVLRTIEHEAVGHYGTEAYLGKEADPFYNRVYLKFGRTGLKDIADERGFDLNTREGRINAAKEKVAQLSETNENPGLLKQLYAWIRAQISKAFPDSKITDAEIQRVISNARKSMISGEFAAREAKIDALKRQILAVSGLAPEEPFRPAQFSIGGKAKEVGTAAYEEEVKPVGKGLKEGWEWFVNKISPTTGVLPKNLDLMFKFLGEREMARNRVEMQTEAGVNALNKLSEAERVDFIDKIQMGYKFDELPANLREYAQTHRAIEDSLFIKSNAVFAKMDKPSLIAYLENHVRNFWKVVPRGLEDEINRKGFEGLSRRPLEGTRAPLHHQYWTLKEGMANGGVPFTTNLLEITRLNHADTMKLLTAHDMWNAFGDTGLRKFVKFGEAIPEGFRPLEDRIANKYFPPKEAGRWVVEDNVGRLLENYLSRDLVRENPLLKGIMGVKNVTTALELGFSAFHASFETFEAAASQMGLGMRKIWNEGMIKEGLKDILTAPKAGYDLFKIGKDWYRLMRNPDEFIKTTAGQKFIKMFPEAQEDIGWLFYGGGSMRMSESYRINSLNAFRENINSKNYIGAALRSIPALSQVMMRPLFETYIPALKRAQFLKEFNFRKIEKSADLLAGKTTKAEMARDVWKSVEDRFGEMNFDNLWWNRTFKSGLQMMVRSVTWKLGNIREYGKGVTGQSAELLSALKEGRMPKLTQEMAWMWGVATLTAAMASVTQYAFTGKSPENWKDLVYPQIDNQGGRLSLPTYARDFFSAIHSPLKYVGSSMAGWFGRFSDIVNNKDFYGVMVHDPGENAIQKRVDDLIHLAPLPFSIQSFRRMREEGQTMTRQLAGFLGATKAPYWIERSDAEQMASDLKAAHLPQGGRTTADFERGSLIKNYARRYQEASLKGESTAEIVGELHGDINSGKLHMDDLLRFRQRINKEPLIQSVMNLPFKNILSVWNVATGEERKKLTPVLMRKYAGLRSPEDRALYLSKIREIQEEMRQ